MKKLSLLITLLFQSYFAFAQTGAGIYAQVSGPGGRPLGNVTVNLVTLADSVTIKSTATGNDGRMRLQLVPSGNYKLWITHLGYAKYVSATITMRQPTDSVNLGKITLVPSVYQLKEVAITSRKPFVEHRIDRTIVNVDALATNQGISAADVLEKSPGIMIDPVNGAISLEGKQGVAVYIDGRKSYLSGNDLIAYLQSLPSGALQQIELMTTPPARYDASGGAVINLRLKKNVAKGFNGSATAIYGQWRYGKTDDSFNFDYRHGLFNLTGGLGDNQQNYSSENTQNRTYLNPDGSTRSYYALTNFSHGKGYTLSPRLALDYYLGTHTTWGIAFNGLYKPLGTTGRTTSQFAGSTGLPDSTVDQYFDNQRTLHSTRVNLNYRHQYKQTEHELNVDMDYNNFDINSDQLFTNATNLPAGQIINQNLQTGLTPTAISIYALKTDYAQPLRHGLKLEAGLKTSFIHTDNPATYFNVQNNIVTADYTKTNHFVYDENINAAYVNATKDWKRFSAEFGLRAENTNLKGDQLGNAVARDSAFNNHYTDLFPAIFFQYRPDSAGHHIFGLNYSRRIGRPNYQDLNPFVIPDDKFNYNVGNPYLQPAYTQNMELSYTHSNLTVKLLYSKKDGDIQTVNRINGSILYSTFDNVGYLQYTGASVNGSWDPVNWFQLNGFAQIEFQHTQALLNNVLIDLDGTVGYIQGNMQFKAGKGWNVELNGFYQTATTNLQNHQNGVKRLNAVFQKKFSNSLSARLVLTDFLDIFRYGGTFNNLTAARATYYNNFDTRGFNISLTCRFGKAIKDLRQHRSNASDDEQGRVKN